MRSVLGHQMSTSIVYSNLEKQTHSECQNCRLKHVHTNRTVSDCYQTQISIIHQLFEGVLQGKRLTLQIGNTETQKQNILSDDSSRRCNFFN